MLTASVRASITGGIVIKRSEFTNEFCVEGSDIRMSFFEAVLYQG